MRDKRLNYRLLVESIIAGALYFALAAAMITLTSNGRDIAAMWPANAVLVALMLQRPQWTWKWTLLAGFVANALANLVTRGSVMGPLLYGLSNVVESLVVAWGLYAFMSADGILRRPTSLVRFLFWAGFAAPFLSSILGATTASLVFGEPYLKSMLTWYFADALGLIVFTPMFFALFSGQFAQSFVGKTVRQRTEAVALQLLVLVTALGVFRTQSLPVLFLVPLPIMLVTFRQGWLGTKISVMIVAVVVMMASLRHDGPISLADLDSVSHVLFAQFYLAATLMLQMPVAAALTSRSDLIDRLAQREKAVQLLAEQSDTLILSLDRSGTFTRAMGASSRLIGRETAQLLGHGFEALDEEIAERLSASFRETMNFDSFDQAIEFAMPDRPDQWREARFRLLEAQQRANLEVVLTIHDISDRKRREKDLLDQAHLDGMTGLLNRAGFTDRAQRAMAQAKEGGLFLAMIDVDRFKLINDNLGHAAGDAVLIDIARHMRAQLRSRDILARLGGDEFAIILRNVDQAQATDACERLVASIASGPMVLADGKSVTVNISCGLSPWSPGLSLDALKHNADMALYEAKRGGRNRAVAA